MEQVKRSTAQNREFHALISKLGINHDEKGDLVDQYTRGRTKKSSEMFFYEMEHLLRSLRLVAPKGSSGDNHMRRTVFSIAHQLGWETGDGHVDTDRLFHFIESRGVHKKPLKDHNHRELIDLVSQMRKILESYRGKGASV